VSPYELAVGLRYTRARKGSGRNTFISFISLMSMAGIALGVAALIVVLSVMNGFQEELRNRILSVASHIEIRGLPTLADDAAIARTAMANPRVKAAAPYVLGQAMHDSNPATGDPAHAVAVLVLDIARPVQRSRLRRPRPRSQSPLNSSFTPRHVLVSTRLHSKCPSWCQSFWLAAVKLCSEVRTFRAFCLQAEPQTRLYWA